MGRKIVAIWICLAMAFSIIVSVDVTIDFTINVGGTTLYVNTTGMGGAYTKIQDAINNSKDGDTVFVYNGIYYENVEVNKSIDLIGEDRDYTIVDGREKGHVINVSVDWVNITSFTVTMGGFQGRGIRLYYVQNCRITNINTSNNYCGIGIWHSNKNNISYNFVFNDTYGIAFLNSSNNNISDNNVSYCEWGIFVEFSTSDTFSNNSMLNNGIVIWPYQIENCNTHNIDTSNKVNGKPVYYWKNKIGGMVPTGAGQVILANCTDVVIQDQHIERATMGIQILFSSNNYITNNSNKNNINGMSIWNSNENIFKNNTLLSNYEGLFAYYSNRNKIEFNNISANEGNGLGLHYSNANILKGNNILHNFMGIFYMYTDWSNATENLIFNNSDGIYLVYSNNDTFHHNNIMNNSDQVNLFFCSDIEWDDGKGQGNYWSDYYGIDDGSGGRTAGDGVGDTEIPHPFTDQGKGYYKLDNFPLMAPFGNHIILYEGWNLISIPYLQSITDLSSVLISIEGLYDAVQWYDITDTNDPWKHHKVGKPFGNDLSQIKETMGFWIHITNPGDTIFLYNGTQPTSNQTIQLHKGWNMVGYPSFKSYNRTVGMNNLTFDTHVNAIWTYNAATQKYKELTELDYFEIGKGYYIHAIEECTWEIPL